MLYSRSPQRSLTSITSSYAVPSLYTTQVQVVNVDKGRRSLIPEHVEVVGVAKPCALRVRILISRCPIDRPRPHSLQSMI